MMKKLKTLIITLLVVPVLLTATIHAQSQPENSTWYEPATAAAGESITLKAFVYNSVQNPVTLTVEFRSEDKVIGTQEATAGVGGGATISQSWTMPQKKTSVTVRVTNAQNEKRVEVKSLEGIVGVIELDSTQPLPQSTSSFIDSVQDFWHTTLSAVTTWRLKEAAYCQEKKIQYEAKTNVTFQPKEGKNLLPLETVEQQTNVQDSSSVEPSVNKSDYLNLAWTSACSTYFGNEAIFYIISALVIIFIVRLLLSVLG
jgi:hypothetical protein